MPSRHVKFLFKMGNVVWWVSFAALPNISDEVMLVHAACVKQLNLGTHVYMMQLVSPEGHV